jgi:hypothetical protein
MTGQRRSAVFESCEEVQHQSVGVWSLGLTSSSHTGIWASSELGIGATVHAWAQSLWAAHTACTVWEQFDWVWTGIATRKQHAWIRTAFAVGECNDRIWADIGIGNQRTRIRADLGAGNQLAEFRTNFLVGKQFRIDSTVCLAGLWTKFWWRRIRRPREVSTHRVRCIWISVAGAISFQRRCSIRCPTTMMTKICFFLGENWR